MGTLKEKVIFILPGWTYDTSKWEALINLLKESGIETHKLKIPGLEEKIEKPWDINDYTNWLSKKIQNEKREIILLGHSNGGRIALSFVLKNPDKISHLILIGSAGLIDKSFTNKLKKTIFKNLAKAGKSIGLPNFTRKLLYKAAREKDYYKADLNLRETMQNLLNVDVENELSNIDTDTTIIWGENDKTTPMKFAEKLNSGILNSKLFIVKNAKHSPQYTHPLKVREIIKSVLK